MIAFFNVSLEVLETTRLDHYQLILRKDTSVNGALHQYPVMASVLQFHYLPSERSPVCRNTMRQQPEAAHKEKIHEDGSVEETNYLHAHTEVSRLAHLYFFFNHLLVIAQESHSYKAMVTRCPGALWERQASCYKAVSRHRECSTTLGV